MPVYFEYLVKTSLCLAVVFIFYALLLKRMTYYTWNRYYLLTFSMLSFLVPLINISVFVPSQQLDSIIPANYISSISNNTIPVSLTNSYEGFSYLQIFSSVYLLVAVSLVFRLLVQLLSIMKMRSKAIARLTEDVNIYHLSRPVVPFSFFKSIFVNHDSYSGDELRQIIDHEKVHAAQKHTWDVLIAEVICIINWYNPFAWLLKKAIRENLEFLADRNVIANGVEKRNYQYLLLKVTGNLPSSITCNFKFSSLKNRILMMNKTKTSRFHLLKFMLLIPLAMVLLFAFRKEDVNESKTGVKAEEAETYMLSTLTYSIPDEKVKSIVLKQAEGCLLKPGQLLNLKLVFNEKDRIQNVLERNGYRNLKSNSIRFFIDTVSVNKSFSVEIHVDIEPPVVYSGKSKPVNKGDEVPSNLSSPPEPGVGQGSSNLKEYGGGFQLRSITLPGSSKGC